MANCVSRRGVLQGSQICHPRNGLLKKLHTGTLPVLRAVRADQQTEASDTAVLQAISQITQQVDASLSSTLAAAAEAARGSTGTSVNTELRKKVVNGVHKLQTGLLERETEVSRAHTALHCV